MFCLCITFSLVNVAFTKFYSAEIDLLDQAIASLSMFGFFVA